MSAWVRWDGPRYIYLHGMAECVRIRVSVQVYHLFRLLPNSYGGNSLRIRVAKCCSAKFEGTNHARIDQLGRWFVSEYPHLHRTIHCTSYTLTKYWLPYTGHTCTALAVGSAQRLNVSPATYLQAGAVESVGFQCNISAPEKVVVNSVLSGVQQRNLETAWGCVLKDHAP